MMNCRKPGTWEKCHICLSDLILTRASAYGSSHRQDTGQSVPLVGFMSFFDIQIDTVDVWAVFSKTYLLGILTQEIYLEESVSESWDCS